MHNPTLAAALTLILVGSAPALQGADNFTQTKEFRKEAKGYLLEKHSLYERMFEDQKGTKADWVFVDPGFNLNEVRESTVAFFAHDMAQQSGLYFAGMFGNPIVQSFEGSLQTLGLHLVRGTQNPAAQAPVASRQDQIAKIQQDAMRNMLAQNPAMLEQIVDARIMAETSGAGGQMELDLYNAEKEKVGVEEAQRLAKERKEKRRAEIRAEIVGEPKASSDPAPATPEPARPKRPEELPGYVLVCYVTEAKDNSGSVSHIIFGVAHNTTTAEFVLLKDGKPVLAARHNSASMGWGSRSGAKCGEALATAFRVEVPKT